MPNPRVVADVLRERAARGGDEPLVRCGGRWLTVPTVDERSERLAAGLAAHGVTRGERVALIAANREELVLLFFACAKLGAVQVPLNTFLKGDLLRYQLADSAAVTLVADAAGLAAAAPLLDRTDVTRVVRLDEPVAPAASEPAAPADPAAALPADPALPKGVTSVGYAELLAATGPAPRPDLGAGDLLTIMYTSGTTGPSKGCMLSNGYYTASPVALREAGIVADGDRIFCAFQLFHQSAHSVLMQALMTPGGSVAFQEWFSASTFIADARADEATVLWSLGSMAMPLLAQPPSPDDGRRGFRLAVIAAMSPGAQEEFERRFATPVISEIYGQTECLGITFSTIGGRRRPGTVGRPSPAFEVKLVDDHGDEVPVGVVGEIVVRPRAPYSMYSGYWGRPAETVEAWAGLWHHTGDNARADADGFLTFVDRKKDCLRRRGENVSSFEVEAAILAHPEVAQVAVCAVPSPLGEHDIKACIVAVPRTPPTALTPESLFGFFKENLPYFAIPRFVELRDSLPVTEASGRVKKHVLRAEGVTPGTWDLEALGFSVARADRR